MQSKKRLVSSGWLKQTKLVLVYVPQLLCVNTGIDCCDIMEFYCLLVTGFFNYLNVLCVSKAIVASLMLSLKPIIVALQREREGLDRIFLSPYTRAIGVALTSSWLTPRLSGSHSGHSSKLTSVPNAKHQGGSRYPVVQSLDATQMIPSNVV